MRIIVTGSRGWKNIQPILSVLEGYTLLQHDREETVVVCGYDPKGDRPKGVDKLTYQACCILGLEVECHPARWELGRGAGFIRNEEMAEAGAGLCLAFWDGESRGTKDMIDRAQIHNIPVTIYLQDALVGGSIEPLSEALR
jgi:hypothetical protein